MLDVVEVREAVQEYLAPGFRPATEPPRKDHIVPDQPGAMEIGNDQQGIAPRADRLFDDGDQPVEPVEMVWRDIVNRRQKSA